MGLRKSVLGACACGKLPGTCICRSAEIARIQERISLCTGHWPGGGMGDGDGVSRSTGFRGAGISRIGAGVASRRSLAVARGRWRWPGRRHMCRRAYGVFVRGVRIVSSQLFLLRSQFFFVHAAAGLHGIDLSASRPAVEDSLRMLARPVLRLTGAASGSVHGLWRLWKEKTYAVPAAVAAGIAAYYFLFNASFYWWKAGLSFGPRYAGGCIPLLCVGLAVAWERAPVAWRRVLAALAAACSIFVALMVVSTTSQLSMQDSCPIIHSSWREFWSGHMALNRNSMLAVGESTGHDGAFNLGQLIGLHGLASLIPLMVIWTLAALLWWRISRGQRRTEPTVLRVR